MIFSDAVKYDDDYIREKLKSFKLVDIRENYQDVIDEAIDKKWVTKIF